MCLSDRNSVRVKTMSYLALYSFILMQSLGMLHMPVILVLGKLKQRYQGSG